MKKHILLVLTMVFALWAEAQNTPEKQHSLINFNDLSFINAISNYNASLTSLQFVNRQTDIFSSWRETKQGMDSLITQTWNSNNNQWEPAIKYEFYYNDSGINTEAFILSWDATNNVWENFAKYTLDYNEHGDLTQFARYIWSQQWIGQNKTELTYDENGNATTSISYTWDQNTSQWIPNQKHESVYNSNNNVVSSFSYSWDQNTSLWVNTSKTTYVYNSGQQLILSTRYVWDFNNNTWVNFNKNEYSYDAAGNETLRYQYDWDATNNVWKNSTRTEHSYDTDGHMTEEIYSEWDPGCNIWAYSEKYGYIYNTNGKLIMETFSNWDNFVNQWIPNNKTQYTYDLDGNCILETDYNWNINTNQWVYQEKQIFTYDNSYTFDDLLIPFFFMDESYINYYLQHMLTEYDILYWDAANNQWLNQSINILYYSSHETNGLDDINDPGVRVYPNPATDYINFIMKSMPGTVLIELFDTQGRLVISKEASGDVRLWTGNLMSGLYLYRLSYNGKMQQGKIIIK